MPAPTLACECAGPRCWDALREGIAANGRHGVWWCFFSDFSKGSFPHTHHVGDFRRAPRNLEERNAPTLVILAILAANYTCTHTSSPRSRSEAGSGQVS